MTKIIDIEGVGPVYAEKLSALGITTVEKLLEVGSTPKARKELEEKSGISGTNLLKWINRADLFRIKGIGEEYSDLLEAAGVDTVPELAQRNPANLHQQLVLVNKEKKLVRQLPSFNAVQSWVAQAKELPRVISY
jgi:predicted flap endonuclease-1-like 5' DNA nuclease